MNKQKTLNEIVSFKGVGLHTGLESTIYIKPSNADTGIVFRDFNNPDKSVLANIKNVTKLIVELQFHLKILKFIL